MLSVFNSYKNRTVALFCIFTATLFLLICSRCSPFYPLNNYADANCFFTVGKGMIRGVVPYRDLYEQKGPLLYFLYGLASLISQKNFFGVFILECISWSIFLYMLYKIADIFSDNKWINCGIITFLTGTIIMTNSFCSGGNSVEEYCLPIFAYSLYRILTILQLPGPKKALIIDGFLAGCVFFMKFTLVGLWGAWLPIIFIYFLKKQSLKTALAAIAEFFSGFLAACLPWLIYFGINNALYDFYTAYIHNNIFLYSEVPNGSYLNIPLNIAKALIVNKAYGISILIGFILLFFSRKANIYTKISVPLLFLFSAAGNYIGGKSYAYYPLMLAVFSIFIVLVEIPKEKKYAIKIGILGLLITIRFCPNVYFFNKPKSVMPQFEFAEIINRNEAKTLLNYGFMDEGFYTTSGIIPNIKYFGTLNVLQEEIIGEQKRYLREGLIDYVVTKDSPLDFELSGNYELAAERIFFSKSYSSVYYLYKKVHN